MKTVLTIAGYDPSSGAGITADLMVFAAHGLFGTSCITAMTVQSTTGVREVHPIAADIVEKTLACLHEDTPPMGVKIGMIGTSDNVVAIADYVESLQTQREHVPVVLDPVLRSSSGTALLDGAGRAALCERLLGLVDWITPNTGELEDLSGERVQEAEAVPDACRVLQDRIMAETGRRPGILATGGHLQKPDDFLIGPSREGVWVPGERVITKSSHGTGCTLSSAFLSRLALGDDPEDAARRAKAYVAGAMVNATPNGQGHSPLNYLWKVVKVPVEG